MFNIFKGRVKKFITESQHNQNIESQLTMSPQTVEQLREYGVKKDTKLKLEYFFYTNDSEKAKKLSNELCSIGYESEYGTSADDKKLYIITGWSSPISMATLTVMEWTKKMCNLGYCNDCEFDGWGTNPEQ